MSKTSKVYQNIDLSDRMVENIISRIKTTKQTLENESGLNQRYRLNGYLDALLNVLLIASHTSEDFNKLINSQKVF
jgi:hypothetical protein